MTMTNPTFTVSSRLMQDYAPGTAVDYKNDIAAVAQTDGTTLFFSIGSDERLYLFAQAQGTKTGWNRVDLSTGMDDYRVLHVAAERDERGAPLAVAVMQSKTTNEASVFMTKDFTAASGAGRWIFRGKRGGMTVGAVAASHGKDGRVLVVLTAVTGDSSVNYVVNPNTADTSWLWREVPSPVDVKRVIKTAVGHQAKLEALDGVDGLLYTLYETATGGETAMVITSLPDFTVYNHQIPLDYSPSAFGITKGASGDSELVLGEKSLFYLTPAAQAARFAADVKTGSVAITTAPTAYPAKEIELGLGDGGKLEAWALTTDGHLSRTYQLDAGGWASPLPFMDQIGEMVTWKKDDASIVSVFTVDLADKVLLWRRDPRTTLWKSSPVMIEDLDSHVETTTYATQLRIVDGAGAALAGQKVTVRASELTQVTINHDVYYVDPSSDSVVCETDATGTLTIVNRVDGLSTPTIRLQCATLGSQWIDVDPAAEIRAKLSSASAADIAGAQMQSDTIGATTPMLPGKTADDLADSHTALQQLLTMSTPPAAPRAMAFVARPADTPFLNRVAYGALPADYRWSFDLTGAKPTFTSGAALAPSPAAPRTLALAATSVLDDVEHFFGDLWHAIKHGFVVAEKWVVQKVSDGIHFIVTTAEKVYQVVIKTAEQLLSVIEYVFQKIGAAFMDLVRWLGFIFAWKDIVRTHRVLRTVVNLGINEFIASLTNAEDRVHEFFTELKSRIIGKDFASQLGPWASGTVADVQSTHGHSSPFTTPESNWTIHHAAGRSLVDHGDAAPVKSSSSISDVVKQDIAQLKTLFTDTISDYSLGKISFAVLVKRLVDILEVAVIDTIEAATLGMIEVVKAAVALLRDVLDAEWKIPLISSLYKAVTGDALTLLDLAALLAAVPATILYKVATDHAPFSDAATTSLVAAQSFDDFVHRTAALDGNPPPHVFARAMLASRPMALAADDPPQKPPVGVRGVTYALGFAVGVSWIVYGITNGLAVSMKPEGLPTADKVKLVSGLLVNGLSFIPMALTLYYADSDIPPGAKADKPRLGYEMFVTSFQLLFNVKDGLMVAEREGPDDFIVVSVLFDGFETVLGVLNVIWYSALAIAEGVQGDMSLGNGLKLAANLASATTQCLSVVGDIVQDPRAKLALTVVQVGVGAVPGVITCIRTGIDIGTGEIGNTF